MIFYYKSKKEMPPRGRNKYFTTYYKQYPDQIEESKQMLVEVCQFIYDQLQDDTEYAEFMLTPLAGYTRENKTNYTPDDIITDMLGQYMDGRDLCSGMLGRWNRLFKDTEYEIELVEDITVHFNKSRTQNTFHSIFTLK